MCGRTPTSHATPIAFKACCLFTPPALVCRLIYVGCSIFLPQIDITLTFSVICPLTCIHWRTKAPVVKTADCSFHVTVRGIPAYKERYARTFGFYQGRAAVTKQDGAAFHLLFDGRPLAQDLFWRWCGNFQGGFCPVQRNEDGLFSHIRWKDGSVLIPEPLLYAGDFRERYAAVRLRDGNCAHVTEDGKLVTYDRELLELGPFHKGGLTLDLFF